MPTLYLITISIIGWGVGYIFYKIANNNIHPIMVSLITTITYIIFTPIIFFSLSFDKKINIIGVISTIVGAILLGIGSMAYYYAIKTENVGVVTATTALYPVVTLILSCLFMGEEMTVRKTIGILLACVSFYFLSWK